MIKVRYPVSGAALVSDVEGVGLNVVLKLMYYRGNSGMDLSWTRNQWTSLLVWLFLSVCSYFFISCIWNHLIFVILFWSSRTVHSSWQRPGLSCFPRKRTKSWVPVEYIFFLYFPHQTLYLQQCCFCFFLAVWTNICFMRVTSHVPNHIETCSQRQQTGADPKFQLRQAYIKGG